MRLKKIVRLSLKEITSTTLRRNTTNTECSYMSFLLWTKYGSLSLRSEILWYITERRKKLQSQEVHQVKVKGNYSQQRCPTPLVESDVESDSDCDSQPDLNAKIEAGGDDEVMD